MTVKINQISIQCESISERKKVWPRVKDIKLSFYGKQQII